MGTPAMDKNEKIIAQLLNENERLQEQVRRLQEMLVPPFVIPENWGLTKTQKRTLAILLSENFITKSRLFTGLYGDRLDPPGEETMGALLCFLRKKLAPLGIVITTIWGEGYRLENRNELAKQLSQFAGDAA